MFTNPNLIYLDRFVFCSTPRLFICLRMRMSASHQYANVYVKPIFLCPGSIAGLPFDSARRFRPTLLLHTTYVHSCCTWRASCVAAFKNKKKKHFDFITNQKPDLRVVSVCRSTEFPKWKRLLWKPVRPSINFSSGFSRILAKETQKSFDTTQAYARLLSF